ncbi:MAG: zinc metallopeptidase [Myxococcales bacterium]|nr:zinc metallopeptidase [Myxococcales bacterium]
MFFAGIDPLFMLVSLAGMALSLAASFQVKATFRKYSQVRGSRGLTGAEAARQLLRAKGIGDVRVEQVDGFLADHYDPGAKTLRLSPQVYHERSLAALGVAAHEAGHAIQHATGYAPLKFRSLVVKPAALGSNLGVMIVTLGIFTQMSGLVMVGVGLFSAFVLFTLVTLPVEFNASSRAVAVLQQHGIITAREVGPTKKVLNAAAMTYVAAAIAAIMQLLYFLWRAGLIGNAREE